MQEKKSELKPGETPSNGLCKPKVAICAEFPYPWRIDLANELSTNGRPATLYCSRGPDSYPWERQSDSVYMVGNKYLRFLSHYVRNKPDLLVSFASEKPLSMLLYAISKFTRTDVILVVEENKERTWASPILAFAAQLKRLVVKAVHKNARVLIAESSSSRDYLLRMDCSPARIHVMAHGTNVDTFKPRSKDLQFAERIGMKEYQLERTCVLFVGKFIESKGAQYIAEAILKMREDDRLLFLIPAFGSDFPEYEESLKRSTNVHLYPPLEFDDMPSLFSLADIVILPSKKCENTSSDRSPNALIEALASGKAVIASRVGGIPTIMGGAGKMIRPNDANAISKAIASLVSDQDAIAQLGTKARHRAVAVLNNRVYATHILDLWRQNFKQLAE